MNKKKSSIESSVAQDEIELDRTLRVNLAFAAVHNKAKKIKFKKMRRNEPEVTHLTQEHIRNTVNINYLF